jgi:hypothetical protein
MMQQRAGGYACVSDYVGKYSAGTVDATGRRFASKRKGRKLADDEIEILAS